MYVYVVDILVGLGRFDGDNPSFGFVVPKFGLLLAWID